MSKLKGKVAVVTGASKGIGAAIAKSLAAEGAAVVVNYASSKPDAERVVAAIQAAGGKAIAIQADVARSTDVQRLFAETKQAYGRLDILVNNAGVYRFAPLEDANEEEFNRQFGTNVLGTILAAREAVALFDGQGGTIINVGSVASTSAPAHSVIYSATKGAVDVVTRVLAHELAGRNIRVNSINPGGVETEGTHAAGIIGSDFEKQIVAQTPLGRLGQPADIASIAVFLASADSGWMTGESLLVSGGMR
ncbi:SDR family NAD(P)-dependent oxidoreductase [Dokdonella sp.]|uniref:SDR family NAD(P)-dependent oxidoreductase n=1 Tax=Dokdonella sp. TaxID=2291710 RepID=UPI003783941C